MKYDIFISYRREGGDKYARTIQQALEKQYRVFLDFDELKDGVFDQRIIDVISESPVFLLILSKGALNRCMNENDWVRQEILQAVKCGCHIVPVTIDDTFEGLPTSLPEELRHAVGQHQFSELQMKTLFKVSMEQLMRDRIAPYVRREETTAGIEVHIDVDADCDLFRFKTFIRNLKAGEDNVIHLSPGKYKLDFISTQEPEVKSSMVYSLAPSISCDFIEMTLKEKVEEVLKKRKVEEEQHKHEEETRRKVEEAKKKTEEEELARLESRLNALEKLTLTPIKQNEKYGFANIYRTIVIPCQWKKTWPFSEGLAAVQNEKDMFGFIDKTGTVVIPFQRKLPESFSEGRALVKDSNNKYGFINKTGNVVIPCQWTEAGNFSYGLAKVKDNNGKYGFNDLNGKIAIPSQWEYAATFSEGLALVRDNNGKYGFIDNTGKIVIPCQWKKVSFFSRGFTKVKDAAGKWWKIDKTGKIIEELNWFY